MGSKRVGLAVSNEEGTMAFPLPVVVNNKDLLGAIISIMKERDISEVVLGESKSLSGQENPIMAEITVLKKALEEKGITVYFEPEFLTTIQASRLQGRVKELDSSAAALILKSYLDKQKQ